MKFLCKKKQKLNNDLYKIPLRAAQEWGNSWYTILDSVIDSTNLELERKYKTIDAKLKKLCKSKYIYTFVLSHNGMASIKFNLCKPLSVTH